MWRRLVDWWRGHRCVTCGERTAKNYAECYNCDRAGEAMRAKQALSGDFVRARSTMGRLEVEGTWQKDPKRRLIVRLDAEEVALLEHTIAMFKKGNESAVEPGKPVTQTESGPKTFKTIGDV